VARANNKNIVTTGKSMKLISHVLLLVIAVSTLAACGEQGVGPSKPKAESSKEAK
jgi:hypothetical protein